ncbi:MAG: ATPase domain-containing protein [Gemmatimonadota bacterium]
MVKKSALKTPGNGKVPIHLLKTGVVGLDAVLGGGLPELSFNLISGAPGAGKTTMAMQLLFANATKKRPGLFITLLGEPSLKMLRYQQQFEFFDLSRVGFDIYFSNLTEEVLGGNLDSVYELIVAEVARLKPGVVVIDSFRALLRTTAVSETGNHDIEHFVQRLAQHLTTAEITSFLVGEYSEQEMRNPIFTVADGIFWLFQAVDRNSVVRKLQVMKMRGMPIMPGLHTVRLSGLGLQVFPRTLERTVPRLGKPGTRLSTGVTGLDAMMGGGIPSGSSMVLAGPTGTGKTTFATMFIAQGIREGQKCVLAIFEEHPNEYLKRANSFGVDFTAAIKDGSLRVMYLRPLDLSVDETLEEIREAAKIIGATRVVIDSTSGLEMALAPTFREDFRESLYRLVSTLTGLGVTILLTVEVVDQAGLQFTNDRVSFLTDIILVQRFVEIEGDLRKVLAIIKMRGSTHSTEFRSYEITPSGVLLRGYLRNYSGVLSGEPVRQIPRLEAPLGLTGNEATVLEVLLRSGPASLDDIEQSTGIKSSKLGDIVDRLTRLKYVTRKGARYEGVAHAVNS